jgi:hypothetical protein
MKAIPRKIAQGLVLLILFCGTPHAMAEIQVTITSITQDSADAASPYNFTVNFSALETSRTNRSVSSAELLVNDNVVGECATGSGGANGNIKNSNAKTGSYEVDNATNGGNSAGFNYSGLAAGSYTIKLTIFNGNNCSGAEGTSAGFAFTVTDDNAAPVVSDAGATLAYTEGDSATVIDGTLTITDVDDTNMEGATITITISSGYQASEDVLALGNTGLGISVASNSSGVLTLSGSASKANYETAFESITYQNTNTDDPDNTNRTITWVVSDGTANSSGVTSTITVADVNDAPVVSDAGGTLSFSTGGSATVIDGTLTITDVDDTNMESATITISSGYESSEDVLAFTNANGITGSWDSGTGVLTLSGTASKANYETAFESVTYQNTDTGSPDTSDRIATWLVSDGDTNSAAGVTSTISVSAPSLHHYAVSYDGGSTTNDANGPNCVATPVTITAHNAGHSAVTTSNTVTLTTSSGNGAWVSNADNASISIGFGGANAITTYLRHPSTGATTINVTDGSNSESEDPTYTFNAASMPLFCEKTEILS